MSRQTLFLLIILSSSTTAKAINVDVGLFWSYNVNSIKVAYNSGKYVLYGDSVQLGSLNEGQQIYITPSGDKVKVSVGASNKGIYSKVYLKQLILNSSTKITSLQPKIRERAYKGDLMVSRKGQYLMVVNRVGIEDYVAGVVEAEAGARQPLEYYKVQAIISRTYALKNFGKFINQGFNICDNVECQVYKGVSKHDDNILKATAMTEGVVIVDDSANLVAALYHSNSGGQTARAEDVWHKSIPYLKSIRDTFSLKSSNAQWTRTIPKKKWLEYLKKKHNFPVDDSTHHYAALGFTQDYRKVYFNGAKYGIRLKQIRRDWRLKSTFFNLYESGDNMVIKGRGFGHGVGLSQQGAMRMASLGYSYKQILSFYFTGIHVVEFKKVRFFNEEISSL